VGELGSVVMGGSKGGATLGYKPLPGINDLAPAASLSRAPLGSTKIEKTEKTEKIEKTEKKRDKKRERSKDRPLSAASEESKEGEKTVHKSKSVLSKTMRLSPADVFEEAKDDNDHDASTVNSNRSSKSNKSKTSKSQQSKVSSSSTSISKRLPTKKSPPSPQSNANDSNEQKSDGDDGSVDSNADFFVTSDHSNNSTNSNSRATKKQQLKFEKELEQMKKNHRKHVEEKKRYYAEELDRIENDHDEEMSNLEARKTKELNQAQNRAKDRLEKNRQSLKQKQTEKLEALEAELEEEFANSKDALTKKLKQAEADLASEVNRAQKRVKETQISEKMKREKEVQRLEAEFSEIQAAHERKMKVIDSEMEDVEEKMTLVKQIKAVNSKVKSLEAEKSKAEAALKESEARANAFEEAKKNLKASLKSFEDKEKSNEALVEDLKDSLEKLKQQKEEVVADMTKLKETQQLSKEEKVRALQEENLRLSERITSEQEDRRVEVEKMKKSIRESNESNTYVLNQVEVLKGDLAESQKNARLEIEDLKKEVKEGEEKIIKLNEEAKLMAGMKKILRGDKKEESMSLISLFKNGQKGNFKRRIMIGTASQVLSGRRKEAGEGSAADNAATKEKVVGGSASLSLTFGGEGCAQVGKMKVEGVAGSERTAPVSNATGSNGTKETSIQIDAERKDFDLSIYKVSESHTTAKGTLIINHSNTADLISSSENSKRYMAAMMGDICRFLTIESSDFKSSSIVLSNLRSHPVLIDVSIIDRDDALELMGKLRVHCTKNLANCHDLGPLLLTPVSASVTAEITELKAHLKSFESAKDELNKRLETTIKAHKDKVTSLDQEAADLKFELENARKLNATLSSSSASTKSEIASKLVEATKKLDAEKSNYGKNIREIEEKLAAGMTELKQTNQKLLSSVKDNNELQKKLDLLTLKNKQAEEQITGLMRAPPVAAPTVVAPVVTADVELQAIANSKMQKANEEISNLSKNLFSVKMECDQLEVKMLSISSEKSHLEHQIGLFTEERKSRENEKKELMDKFTKAEEVARRGKLMNDELEWNLSIMKRRVEELEGANDKNVKDKLMKEEEVRRVRGGMREGEEELRRVEREVQGLRGVIEEKEKMLTEVEANGQKMGEKIVELLRVVELEKGEAEKWETVKIEYEKKIGELEREGEHLKMKVAAAAATINTAPQAQQQPKPQQQQPNRQPESEPQQEPHQQPQTQSPQQPQSEEWNEKVEMEKKLINEAQTLLRQQKSVLQKRRKQLERSKESWKLEKDALHIKSAKGTYDAGSLKRKRNKLMSKKKSIDDQALALNVLVKKFRKTESWLASRTNKVDNLEDIIKKMINMKEGEGSEEDEDDNSIISHVRALQQITSELDTDTTFSSGFMEVDIGGGLEESTGDYVASEISSSSGGEDFSIISNLNFGKGGRGRRNRNDVRNYHHNYHYDYHNQQQQQQYLMPAWEQQQMQQQPIQNMMHPIQTMQPKASVATFQQQLKKWTRERNEVQRDVAHHVSWLDDLRKELTSHCYNGNVGTENEDPNMSANVNALLSPRQTDRAGGGGSRSILKNRNKYDNFSGSGDVYPREV